MPLSGRHGGLMSSSALPSRSHSHSQSQPASTRTHERSTNFMLSFTSASPRFVRFGGFFSFIAFS